MIILIFLLKEKKFIGFGKEFLGIIQTITQNVNNCHRCGLSKQFFAASGETLLTNDRFAESIFGEDQTSLLRNAFFIFV